MRLAWAGLALWVTGGGTLAMALAPFLNPGEPVMANLIPVLESPLFLPGLVVFGLGRPAAAGAAQPA